MSVSSRFRAKRSIDASRYALRRRPLTAAGGKPFCESDMVRNGGSRVRYFSKKLKCTRP